MPNPVANGGFEFGPLAGASFGRVARFTGAPDARAAVAAAEAEPELLPRALHASQGLLLVPAMQGITEQPELLVRLSRLFGPEVENYHETLAEKTKLHESVAEILVISNMAPAN